jgi:hypothetical protein
MEGRRSKSRWTLGRASTWTALNQQTRALLFRQSAPTQQTMSGTTGPATCGPLPSAVNSHRLGLVRSWYACLPVHQLVHLRAGPPACSHASWVPQLVHLLAGPPACTHASWVPHLVCLSAGPLSCTHAIWVPQLVHLRAGPPAGISACRSRSLYACYLDSPAGMPTCRCSSLYAY